ncbi:MAG: tyrosine-type recombinase/integrase [Sphingomonadales bacterium]|nr:tyrosine-type recombinase/integrase [Sphingomonadales bacterium]
MPRKLHNALNPVAVRAAGPGRHADGGGLYLRVQEGGAKSWLFRAIVAGKARDIGLGPAAGADAIPLARARDLARELAAQAARGEAIEGKRTIARKAAGRASAKAAASRSFREVAETFISGKEGGWRNEKHRQQWRNTLATYAYPVIGALPPAEIETAHVLAVLEPIWKTKPETASRLRGRIERVLDAAKVRGLRSGENVARWRGHLDHLLQASNKLTRGHHAALAYAELPAFVADLAGRDALAARALEFLILTACRSGELLGATWREIDLGAKVWTIPAARMKAGREHVIPLAPRALAILADMARLRTRADGDAPLFPASGGGALSTMALPMLLRRMNDAERAAGREGWIDRRQDGRAITVHGFRSTFRDWAGEQTSFPREVIEHALAHLLADKAEAAYQRATLLPKRAKLMEAWANYPASAAAPRANVAPIGKARAG